VPDEELHICFLYEYAREHAKASKRWQTLTKRSRAENYAEELIEQILSIFGEGDHLHWFLEPAFVTTPWHPLDKKLKREETGDFNDKKSKAQSFRESINLKITLQRDLPEYARAGAKDFASWIFLDSCWHDESSQREYGFFAINWNYTDGDLIDEFKKWLAERRGERRDIESRQGKDKFRQYLKALGAKRLLDSDFTVANAMEYTERFLKNEEGNPHPLYESERGWSKAKNETVPTILKRLFPVCE
jgi:hypothetical protein